VSYHKITSVSLSPISQVRGRKLIIYLIMQKKRTLDYHNHSTGRRGVS